jgi:hypothetical protein
MVGMAVPPLDGLAAELLDDALPNRLANNEHRAGSGVGDAFGN